MTDADPFFDLYAYVHLPRLGGLWLSPDGRRLVVGVATPNRKNTRYSTALWEVDPDGQRPARRLTRSAEGEAAAAFTPGGDLLFTSTRPVPAIQLYECELTGSWQPTTAPVGPWNRILPTCPNPTWT